MPGLGIFPLHGKTSGQRHSRSGSTDVIMAEFIGLKDVAERLHLSERTVRRLFQTGQLPATKLGRQWLTDWHSLERTLIHRCTDSIDDPTAHSGKPKSPGVPPMNAHNPHKRFRDALSIQEGASNPSGVARALVTAIDDTFAEGADTVQICNDPAVRLICHQLAYLLRIIDPDKTASTEELPPQPLDDAIQHAVEHPAVSDGATAILFLYQPDSNTWEEILRVQLDENYVE